MSLASHPLTPYITPILAAFTPLAFPPNFGFDPLTHQEVFTFFESPAQFELSLKKEKGKNILYSAAHTALRQQLINSLPTDLRCHYLLPKLEAQGLLTHFQSLNPKTKILDIRDIGAGHSVYHITMSHPILDHTQWVIKKEDLPNQCLFTQLLHSIGWPTYHSHHIKTPHAHFECSEYLGNVCLYNGLQNANTLSKIQLYSQLAQHAALGDILGRGDRHINNYMVTTKGLLPIDISFLFWEGNEDWNKIYIAGGLYEFSMLSLVPEHELETQINAFFDTYYHTLAFLKSRQSIIENQLATFCTTYQMNTEDKLNFIRTRLNNIQAYFNDQKSNYLTAFQTLQERLILKKKFFEKIIQDPQKLESNPLQKMYYLADKDQPSCFFLLEKYPKFQTWLESL